ncbi:MAG: dTMP kinase [Kineosporiaceae bacterium]
MAHHGEDSQRRAAPPDAPATRAALVAPAGAHADAPDHDVRAVLAIPTFRRLWLALTFSSFGDWLGLLATIALAATLAGDSTFLAGAAVSATLIMRLLPSLALGPVAGALADRFDRRWTMVAGDLVRFVLFCSIPLVGTLTWLLVATLLIECAALVWGPAKEATVPNLVPRRRLEAANQISLAATYGTAPVAAVAYSGLALLTGILDNFVETLRANPIDLALYVNGLSFLVSAITIARLSIPRGPGAARQGDAPPLWRSMLEGWRFIGGTPVVRGLVLGMLGAFAAAGLVIGPARQFVRALGGGDPGYGLLFGAVFVGLAVGMWLGPRFLPALSRRRLFGLSLAAAGVLLVLLAIVPNIVIATLLTTGLGAFGGLAWVTGYTLLGLVVDDEVRGRTFGFLQAAARLVLVLVLAAAPPLAGIIGDHTIHFTPMLALTYSGAAVLYLAAGLVAVVLGVAAFRQMDDRRGIALRHDLLAAWRDRMGSAPRPAPAAITGRGAFVAFEGGDGTGKSTQARLLAEWLRADGGHEVVLTREPGGSEVGSALRALLLERDDLDPRAEALIFAADRAQHVATVVQPALESGAVVVTDRYVDSSVAYQGAGLTLDPDEVERLSGWATQQLVPDLTVLLDLPAPQARARRAADASREGEDRIEAGGSAFHERVRGHFLALASRAPHRYVVLDATASVEDLQDRIRERVAAVLPVSARRREEIAAAAGLATPVAADADPGSPVEAQAPGPGRAADRTHPVHPAHGVGPAHAVVADPGAVPAVDPDLDPLGGGHGVPGAAGRADHDGLAGQGLDGAHAAPLPPGHLGDAPARPPAASQLRQDELLTMALPLAEPEMARPFVPWDRVDEAPPYAADTSDVAALAGGSPEGSPEGAGTARPVGSRRLLREQEQRGRGDLADGDLPLAAASALSAQLTEVLPDLSEVFRETPEELGAAAAARGPEAGDPSTALEPVEQATQVVPSVEESLPVEEAPARPDDVATLVVEAVAAPLATDPPREAPDHAHAHDLPYDPTLDHAGAIDLRELREDLPDAAPSRPEAARERRAAQPGESDLGEELFGRFGA